MKTTCSILFILLFCLTTLAQKNTRAVKDNLPAPKGYVNDFAHILSIKETSQLSATLAAFDSLTTNQMAVVTVNSTLPLSIEVYAKRLFNKWGIGEKNKNNGILFLVAYKDRKVRIATGTGIEAKLTDSLCKEIIDEILIPHFKENEFYEGISIGIEQVKGILEDTLEVNSAANFNNGPAVQNVIPVHSAQQNNNNDNFLLTALLRGIGILLVVIINFFQRVTTSGPSSSLPKDDPGRYSNTNNYQDYTTDNSSYVTMPGSFDNGVVSSPDSFNSGSTDGGGASGSW